MFLKDVQLQDTQSLVQTSNGASIICNKIPVLLFQAFDRAHNQRRPSPPMKEVQVLGGKTVWEEDPDAPDYLLELAALETEQSEHFMALAMDFMEIVDDDKKQKTFRDEKMARWGLEPNDNQQRIEAFGMDNPEHDIEFLSKELVRLSTVTAAEVRKQEDGFRPEVDGNAGDETGDATEPPDVRPEGDSVPGIPVEKSSGL